jgi:hypothetical protein
MKEIEISDVYDGTYVMIKRDNANISLDRFEQYEVFAYLKKKIGEGR